MSPALTLVQHSQAALVAVLCCDVRWCALGCILGREARVGTELARASSAFRAALCASIALSLIWSLLLLELKDRRMRINLAINSRTIAFPTRQTTVGSAVPPCD